MKVGVDPEVTNPLSLVNAESVVGFPVTPVQGTAEAVVAVVAFPVTLIPQVPEAQTHVRVGEKEL